MTKCLLTALASFLFASNTLAQYPVDPTTLFPSDIKCQLDSGEIMKFSSLDKAEDSSGYNNQIKAITENNLNLPLNQCTGIQTNYQAPYFEIDCSRNDDIGGIRINIDSLMLLKNDPQMIVKAELYTGRFFHIGADVVYEELNCIAGK